MKGQERGSVRQRVGPRFLLASAGGVYTLLMQVRPASRGDLPWLLTQCRAFARFYGSGMSLFPGDDAATATLSVLIETQPFFVAEDAHGPAGFIVGLLSPHWMNQRIRTLAELLWWVAEDRRGSSAGARLLDTFIAFGRDHADWISFTLEAASPVKHATLERRGFRLHERAFLLEVA